MQQNWVFSQPDPELQQQTAHFYERWKQNGIFEIQSSGTTGVPQIQRFTKEQLAHSALASIQALQLTADTHALLCLPLNSVGGLMLLARSIVGSFALTIEKPSSRPLQHHLSAFDFVAMVPTQLQQSLEHDLTQLKRCGQILVGGGALSAAHVAACQDAGLLVWQSYGMTETLSHVALRQVSPIEEPAFKALPGIQFSCKNDCLTIHYPQLQKEPIVTKDIVELHDPTHFTWLGRTDNAINSGGIKIIPEILEGQLEKYLDCAFFITAVPDQKWGQVVAIVIEAAQQPTLPDFRTLPLKPAEIPKKYALVNSFLRTNTQKIQRQAILQALDHEDWRSL